MIYHSSECMCSPLLQSPPFRTEQALELVEDAELGLVADHSVDPGGVDVGMAEDVGESDDVPLLFIVGNGEEVTEIVREDFFPEDTGGACEGLHPAKDVAAVNRSSGSGDEDAAGCDGAVPAVGVELSAEFFREKDDPGLAFEGDDRAAGSDRGVCDIGQFADAYACGRKCLHDEGELAGAFLSSSRAAVGGAEEALVLLDGEFLLLTAESGALGLEGGDAAFVPVKVFEEGVECREHGVCAGDLILLAQVLFVQSDFLLVHAAVLSQPGAEVFDISAVFLNGCGTFFMFLKHPGKLPDRLCFDYMDLLAADSVVSDPRIDDPVFHALSPSE